ncbi:MAG: hypothetical protein IJZ30_03400 [Alphaproteobacteria bacterium]|nr:hypothetical protein [Alphaproteobacteria bacterium]
MKRFPYIRQLLSPLSYLFVKHSCCIRVTWVYSFVLSFITVFSLYSVSHYISYSRFIPDASQFLGLLSGFYITSLSILASNGNSYLDEELQGEQPSLDGKVLNRRKFLCLLLGYLTFSSIILFLSTMFVDIFMKLYNGTAHPIELVETYKNCIISSFLVIYYWLFFSLINNTLLCIHFIFINLPIHQDK